LWCFGYLSTLFQDAQLLHEVFYRSSSDTQAGYSDGAEGDQRYSYLASRCAHHALERMGALFLGQALMVTETFG